MPTSTTNYGLIKPGTDDPILVGQLNDNMDTIDTVLKDHSDKIDAAALGIKFKGEVNYYADLPNNAEIGDAYTVKYAGSSGTTPDETEYVWGAVSGTNQWINFSKDSYTKAEVDALLTLKQNALNSAQLAAANSGIDSAKVEQIETNKNNISISTIEIADCLTMAEGYTADSLSKIYKQGNHIFGQLIINKNDGNFGGAQETIGRFKSGYRPKDIQIQQCAFSTTAYNTQNIGYSYIQFASGTSNPGTVIVKGYATDVGSYVNIRIDFVT